MQYFSVLVKPASSLCNLRCSYCFYEDVAQNREHKDYGMMRTETVDILLHRISAFLAPPSQLTILFQGGEPTLAGLPFFEYFVRQCSQRLPRQVSVNYSLQTNGLLLDDAWCTFLKTNGFLVGLSLDGPAGVHDQNRLTSSGSGSFTKVKKALALLNAHRVSYNLLCVVSKAAARHPDQLFSFFEKSGAEHVQFIPCLNPLDETQKMPFAIDGQQYAACFSRLFALWLESLRQGKHLHIRSFENLLQQLQGRPAEQCGAMGFCTPQFVVEADGSVFPCDFYVLDAYCCGNVHTHTIDEMRSSGGMQAFLAHNPPKHIFCKDCELYNLCGGGCKRYRSFYTQAAGFCPQKMFLQNALRLLNGR